MKFLGSLLLEKKIVNEGSEKLWGFSDRHYGDDNKHIQEYLQELGRIKIIGGLLKKVETRENRKLKKGGDFEVFLGCRAYLFHWGYEGIPFATLLKVYWFMAQWDDDYQ